MVEDVDNKLYGVDIHNSWTGDGRGDWQLIRGRDNLYQALYNRLMTARDELTHLGYIDYGTVSVVGEPGTPGVLDLAVVYIEDSLRRDPRVEDVEVISFELQGQTLTVEVDVTPIYTQNTTNYIITIENSTGEQL